MDWNDITSRRPGVYAIGLVMRGPHGVWINVPGNNDFSFNADDERDWINAFPYNPKKLDARSHEEVSRG